MRRRDPRYPIAERLARMGFGWQRPGADVYAQQVAPPDIERCWQWLAARTTITDVGPAENPRVYQVHVAKAFEAWTPTLPLAMRAAELFLWDRACADQGMEQVGHPRPLSWLRWERAFDPGGFPTWTIQDPQ